MGILGSGTPARVLHSMAEQSNGRTRWRRTQVARDTVCSEPDLVALILRGNVGMSTFESASLVCKAWLGVCRGDEGLLRGVALYTEGLTKGAFLKLFAVSSSEAAALPHTSHKRYGGGSYFLYRQPAVDAVLARDGAMAAWRERLRRRGGSPARYLSLQATQPAGHRFRSPAAQEEFLRYHAMQRQAWRRIKACD